MLNVIEDPADIVKVHKHSGKVTFLSYEKFDSVLLPELTLRAKVNLRTRYPDDGLDNLVAAHAKCNNNKRDFLAAAEHVEHWAERTRTHDCELNSVARQAGWHRDAGRSASVAAAIYLRLPTTARPWHRREQFVLVERDRIERALAV